MPVLTHRHVEDRRAHVRAVQRPVALVVRVGHQRDARRQQLRAGGGDLQVGAVGAGEQQAVERARALPVLQLGLGDGRAEGDVPEGRCLGEVGLAAGEVAQERPLRRHPGAGADRAVGRRPVDRQPEASPELLERDLVGLGEALAERDEVPPRHRDLALARHLRGFERRVVGERGVAAHAEVVLHAPLGGQAVVVPAHRVEHRPPAHPLVARDDVGVRVGEHVPDVQRPAHRGGRGVDREHRIARCRAVEPVYAQLVPSAGPSRLEAVDRGPLRQGSSWGRHAATVVVGTRRPPRVPALSGS